MKHLLDELGKLWCIHMHVDMMWPFRGRYHCRVCRREYRVAFEMETASPIKGYGSKLQGAISFRRA